MKIVPSAATATPEGPLSPACATVVTDGDQAPATCGGLSGCSHGAPSGSAAPRAPLNRSIALRVIFATRGSAKLGAPSPAAQPMVPMPTTSAPDGAR